MFTGIIEKIGRVRQPGERLVLELDEWPQPLALGESVAVNGCCLTVAELQPDAALFFLSPETLSRTHLGALRAAEPVNLERALLAGARLSGHIVQGHVDGLGRISRVEPRGESHEVEISLPEALGRYCIEKGSIAIDGVSLTLNRLRTADDGSTQASLMVIPHTWSHTTFSSRRAGDRVNVEVDVLAKYVENGLRPFSFAMEKLCQTYRKP